MITKKQKIFVLFCIGILLIGTISGGYLLQLRYGKDRDNIKSEAETHEENITEEFANALLRKKTARPQNVKGIWVSLQKDVASIQTQGQADALVKRLQELHCTVVFLELDCSLNSLILQNENQNKREALRLFLQAAKQVKLFTVLQASFWEGGTFLSTSRDDMTALCKQWDIDSLLLTGSDLGSKTFTAEVEQLASAAKAADTQIELGIHSSAASPAGLEQLFRSKLLSYVCYEPKTLKHARTDALLQVCMTYVEMTKSEGGTVFCSCRVDLLISSGEKNPAEEVIDQILGITTLEGCSGMVLRASALLQEKPAKQIEPILQYLKSNDPNLARRFTVQNLKNLKGQALTWNDSIITFTGTSSPSYPLTCNGKDVERVDSGDYSITLTLKPGKNKVIFSHKGVQYEYSVLYEIKLLDQVTPRSSVKAEGEAILEISAVAHKKAQVIAVLNGKTINLQKRTVSSNADLDQPEEFSSDYTVFSAEYQLPKATITQQNLGKIQVKASLNGIVEIKTGASVAVNALPPVTQLPIEEITNQERTTGSAEEGESSTKKGQMLAPLSLLTPYNNNGISGKARMCEITQNYAETWRANTIDDKYNPTFTPLLKGTFDYITGESSYENIKYYVLASGRRVNIKDVKAVESGYRLPQNRIVLEDCVTTNQSTVLTLNMKWKVPFSAPIGGQTYKTKGDSFSGRLYEVSVSNASYVDFIFYHTASAAGNFDFSRSNAISSATWLADSKSGRITLRIKLQEPGKYYGHSVSYNANGYLIISLNQKPGNHIKDYTIMLNPGHGGSDSGAICAVSSNTSYKYEKQINLAIAKQLQKKLVAAGATVVMTRTGDQEGSKEAVRDMARKDRPDLFIALHNDASTNGSARGTSAYYYTPWSFPLADEIHNRLVTLYKSDFYKGKDKNIMNAVDRHTAFYPFLVTRIENCPSILIEYGFVTNLEECRLLQRPETQEKLAEATLQGILAYINK